MRKVRAHAIKAVIDCIGENQTPAIVVQFEMEDGHTIRKTGWLTDAALEYTIRDLRTCGFVGNDPFVLDGGECAKLLPTEVMLVLEPSERDPRYEDVKFINAIGSELAARSAPTGKTLNDIRARFKAVALRMAAENKSPTASKPDPEPEFDDDDFETD